MPKVGETPTPVEYRWVCCKCGGVHHYRPVDNRCKNPLCQQFQTLERLSLKEVMIRKRSRNFLTS